MLIRSFRCAALGVVAVGAAAAAAQDGLDIPSKFGPDALVVTQLNPTSYGNDTTPCQDAGQDPPCDTGNELDQLFVELDDNRLHVGITGNLQYNGNAILIFLDTRPGVGQTVLLTDPGVDEGPPYAMNGLHNSTLDPGFAPDYCFAVDCFGGAIYVTKYTLEEGVVAARVNGAKVYLGSGFVASGEGDLFGGEIQTNVRVAVDNRNIDGVNGTGDPDPGDATTATTGLEAYFPLREIGHPPFGKRIKVWAMLKSGSGDGYISNQSLPAYVPDPGDDINSIGNEGDPDTRPGYDFAGPLLGGIQWAPYQLPARGRNGHNAVEADTLVNP